MKCARSAAFAFALLLSAPALADEYSDFRIPAHRLFGWSANLSSSVRRVASGVAERYATQRAANGGVSTQGFWISESDPLRTSVTWRAAAFGSRLTQRDRLVSSGFGQTQSTFDESSDKRTAENWQLGFERKIYPRRPPLALEVSAAAVGAYQQVWTRRNSNSMSSYSGSTTQSIDETHQVIWVYNYGLTGNVAIGLGRVRDATGVLDARVFEERLRTAGVLVRPLSPSARERLAAIAYTQYAIARVHDRAGKYLWHAIERVLREDGALKDGGVDPSAVLRGGEPFVGDRSRDPASLIARSPVARTRGVFAGLVVSVTHDHSVNRLDGSQFQRSSRNDTLLFEGLNHLSSRFSRGFDRAYGGGKVEFHLPLGPRWQLDVAEQVLFPLKTPRRGIDVTSNLAFRAIVADRWTAGVFGSQARAIDNARDRSSSPFVDGWRVSFGADLTVYLEDRVQLIVRAEERQMTDRSRDPYANPPDAYFARNGQISLDLTYRFLGGLDAPGLFPPLRIGTGAF